MLRGLLFATLIVLLQMTGGPVSARSFSCIDAVTATERAICADPELRAYDHAMTFAYARGWRPSSEQTSQSAWLRKRDACGRDRDCILAVYRDWIDGLMLAATPKLPLLERVNKVDNNGADLLLANIRIFGKRMSPTGSVKGLGDSGSLFIRALGQDWYFFQIDAAHYFDPHDGRGPNATTSYAAGVAYLPRGRGEWTDDPGEATSCSLAFTRLSQTAWRIVEDGIGCSGIGSTLTGVYRRR